MSNKKNKIFLVSAYACEPNEGSEPGLGWNWAVELSKKNRVIVITRSNNRENIEKEYDPQRFPGLSFEYCDIPRVLSFWKKGQRGLHMYYCMWQLECYRLAKRICREEHVDYALALTFGNMWMPTFLYKLPCSFVWGPIGGGEGVPKMLWSEVSNKQKIFEHVRTINKIFPITNPWFFKACKKAELLIPRTRDSLKCIPEKYRNKCITMLETGVSSEDIKYFDNLYNEKHDESYKNDFVCCGKMIPYKMFSLAIEAFSMVISAGDDGKRLHFIGDGPCRRALGEQVRNLGIEDRVIFHGRKCREETLRILAASKALLLTSAREGGSWVMFEAMLLRKPIICFDTSGMSVVVTKETGRMIDVCEYKKAVKRFAEEIKYISGSADLDKIGNTAYERVVNEFMWESKIKQLLVKLDIEK